MIENIVFLCSEEEKVRERKGYSNALSKVANVSFFEKTSEETYDGLNEKLFRIKPDLLIYPDNYYPRIPLKVERLSVPSACFHFDTYSDTENRMKFSFLFDYVFVSHPRYVEQFKKSGLTNTFLLPHAVDSGEFGKPAGERKFDIGWVGRLDGEIYKERREVISSLSLKYQVNDVYKFYDYPALANIYRQSRIAVNFSRSDYPQDANLRCFEIMAGGALLLTGYPSELEDIGFHEGIHYKGFKDYKDLLRLLDYYLLNRHECEKIAQAGQELTLTRHTYDARAAALLNIVNNTQKCNQKSSLLSYPAIYLNYCYSKELYNEYFIVLNNYSTIPFLTKLIFMVRMLTKFSYRALRNMWV